MNAEIEAYHLELSDADREICTQLAATITAELAEAAGKIWHAHPVWMIDGNPIVGYSKQKKGIRLMFWSGADFDEPALREVGGKFKDASIFYNHVSEIELEELVRWLGKSRVIQWDYKNIVKRKGRLERLETGSR